MHSIRPATTNDVKSVIALFRQSEQIHSSMQPDIFSVATSDEVDSAFQNFLSDSSVVNVVLEIDGLVRAYLRYRVSLFPNISFLAKKGQGRCYIEELVVDQKIRRQGFGKQLLYEVERRMKDEGVKFVHLHVFAFNEAAKSLYEDLGFVPISCELGKSL